MKFSIFILCLGLSQLALSSELVHLKNTFNADEIQWVKEKGTATVSGKAFLHLKNGKIKGCAGHHVELLPQAGYANERILKNYGNNLKGQVLLEDNPPKFTPDVKEYHEMLIQTHCDKDDNFIFNNVPAGNYYLIAFIMWDSEKDGVKTKNGGAVMQSVKIVDNNKQIFDLQVK